MTIKQRKTTTQAAACQPKPAPESERMRAVARAALEDAKGERITVLDVRQLTDITDCMIIATGSSERHIKALAERVISAMQQAGWRRLGVEGLEARDWVLVDFVDVVVHVMRAEARAKYDLESLWDASLGDLLAPPDRRGRVSAAP